MRIREETTLAAVAAPLSGTPARLLGGLASVLLLVGCTQDEARFVTAPEVALGSAIEGELTSASRVHLNDGSRYAAHWLCGGDASASRLYALEAPFAARLSAFDEQGRWLDAAQGDAGEPAALVVGAAEPACTLVVVSGDGSGAFGPYRLTPSDAASETLRAGQPLVGRLNGDTVEHALSLDEPAMVTLRFSGAPGAGVRLVGDDVSESARACGEGELSLETYLDAGEYQVRILPGQAPTLEAEDKRCTSRVLSTAGGYRLQLDQRGLVDGRRNGGPLRDGDRITGRLTGSDGNSYTLRVDEPTRVRVDLRSNDFDPMLDLTGEGLSLHDDDGGDGLNSRLATLLMPGSYRVQVSGYSGYGQSTEAGDYELSLTGTPFDGELRNDGSVTAGDDVNGWLSGSVNRYELEVDEMARVRVALDSSDFDAVLRLHGNGIDISDDDSGGNRNSLINTVLQPGRYVLEVEGYGYDAQGSYQLRVEQEVFDGELRNDGSIAAGDDVSGWLSGSVNVYELEIDEVSEVRVALDSSDFDAMLSLSGEGVSVSDDDSGGNLNSLITTVLQPGRYVLEVSGYGYDAQGSYQLRVEQQAFEGRMADSGELAVGDTVYGNLTAGSPLVYELVLDEAQQVTIESTSSSLDTTLMLRGANGFRLDNDDAPGLGLGARLSHRLEPGTYRIEVAAYGYTDGVVRLAVFE